jgi:hypothetical protein
MKQAILVAIALLLVATVVSAQTVRCESPNNKYHECRTTGWDAGRVVIAHQMSDNACVEGKTWGTRNGMVWVSGGCRADFALASSQMAGTTITCESVNNIRHTCNADVRGGVQLARRLSADACVRGRTWDVRSDGRGIWVDKGCRAEFTIGDAGSPMQHPAARTVLCESKNNGRTRCAADTSFGVQLARQLSENGCNTGRDWGWDQNGVWVDHGCRAEFSVGGYHNGMHNNGSMASSSTAQQQTLVCESRDGKRNYCRANTGWGVTLLRRTSDAACERGQSWGYDENGVWVSNGCRAEFQLDANR